QAAQQPGVGMLAPAHGADTLLVPEPVGKDLRDAERLVTQRGVPGGGPEVEEVQADAGQPAVEVHAEVPQVPTQFVDAELDKLQGFGPVAEMVEHVGDAVQAVVEPEPGPGAGVGGALDQPLLVLGVTSRAVYCDGV